MDTPVKNSFTNMFKSGNIQQELAGILSLSNSVLQSFSNDVRRSDPDKNKHWSERHRKTDVRGDQKIFDVLNSRNGKLCRI